MATRGKKEKEYPPMPANWMYKRGDVYMMDLNPYSGSEQGGIRPAIVVQNDDGNFYSNVLLVVPLTTQIKKRNMPTHFILHNRFLSAPSMAICESPRPADKSRVCLLYTSASRRYQPDTEEPAEIDYIMMPVSELPVSAGLGDVYKRQDL